MRNPTSSKQPVAAVLTEDSNATNLSRRRFLFTLGAGGAGAAVAASGAGGAAAQVVADAPTGDAAAYRVTEHVRDYYRSARI